jgi:20S proteasome alpha/beta subunit
MSLCLAIQSKDSIILASDSRATIGDPRGMTTSNDTVQKVFNLSSKIGIVIAGDGNIGFSIVEQIRKTMNDTMDIDEAIAVCRQTCINNFAQWFPTSNQPMPTAQGIQFVARPEIIVIITGYTKTNLPKIYMMSSNQIFNFAPQPSTMGFGAIGIVPLAVYLLNRLYKPDASSRVVKELATYCILETASQDGKVGGAVQLAEIKTDSGFANIESTGEEYKKILDAIEIHRNKLKESFYKDITKAASDKNQGHCEVQKGTSQPQ